MTTSRREFLKLTGASGALLPLLRADLAHGAGAGPRRLVIINWSDGIRRGDYWPWLGPTGGETDWRLPVPGQSPVAGVAPASVPILDPIVKDFRKDMLLVGGLDVNAHFEARGAGYGKVPRVGDAHDDMAALLTGAFMAQYRDGFASAGGPSIDQFIGRELARKVALPFPALVIGGRAGAGFQGTISYAAADTPGVTPENSPQNLFKTLFAGRSLPKGQVDVAGLTRKSTLDYLLKDLTRFQARLGTDDRKKIDAHLQTIRDLEVQLSAPGGASCAAPAAPAPDFKPNDAYPALLKTQFDLLAGALACDLTRVATFNFETTGGNDIVFSWLGAEFVGKGDDYPTRQHHDLAHAEYKGWDWARRHSMANQWFMSQVAYFLGLLKAIPEGSGSVLDDTAVLVMNSMGQNHWSCGVPALIVGSCGGAIRTGGRFMRVGDWAASQPRTKLFWGDGDGYLQSPTGGNFVGPNLGYQVKGVPLNRLLVALANAMGVPVDTFGQPEYGGVLPGVLA